MRIFGTALIAALALFNATSASAQVPEQCVQSPWRTSTCPHALYRIAKAPVPAMNIAKGGMVCLCLSDLTDLPPSEQVNAFTAIADQLNMPVNDLFILLEKPTPKWAPPPTQP